jgi:hypothetical protein
MSKLSLVGMQLPEKYKENFNVSSDGLSSAVTPDEGPSLETSKFSLNFSDICIPTNYESFFESIASLLNSL